MDKCKQEVEFSVYCLPAADVQNQLVAWFAHKLLVRRQNEELSRAWNMHNWLAVLVQQSVSSCSRQTLVTSAMLVNCCLEHLCC